MKYYINSLESWFQLNWIQEDFWGHLLLTPKKLIFVSIQMSSKSFKKVDDSGIWKSRYQGKGYKFHARLQIMPKTLLTTCPTRFLDGVLPLLISIDFKSLVYSGTVDNLYLLDRLLVMYFSTPFLLQNLYWIFRRLPASFIQTVTRSIYFYKKKESRQLSRNIK